MMKKALFLVLVLSSLTVSGYARERQAVKCTYQEGGSVLHYCIVPVQNLFKKEIKVIRVDSGDGADDVADFDATGIVRSDFVSVQFANTKIMANAGFLNFSGRAMAIGQHDRHGLDCQASRFDWERYVWMINHPYRANVPGYYFCK